VTKSIKKQFTDSAPVEKWNNNCKNEMQELDIKPQSAIEFEVIMLYYDGFFNKYLNVSTQKAGQALQKYIDMLIEYPDYIGPYKLRTLNLGISAMTAKGDNQFEKYRKELFREFDEDTLKKKSWIIPKDYDKIVLEPLGLSKKENEKEAKKSPTPSNPSKYSPNTTKAVQEVRKYLDEVKNLPPNSEARINKMLEMFEFIYQNMDLDREQIPGFKNSVLTKLDTLVNKDGRKEFQKYYDLFRVAEKLDIPSKKVSPKKSPPKKVSSKKSPKKIVSSKKSPKKVSSKKSP
jgi:hypothetical protein